MNYRPRFQQTLRNKLSTTMRCVALFSGGLDSMLAIRAMQRQGIEVEAITLKTVFACCDNLAGPAARELGVHLTVVTQQDDYFDLLRRPRFGRGRGANPCIDCRIYMFRCARRLMEQMDCRFVVSGEVIGQRPSSQKRRDLPIISHHSGLDDLLLRPLSAKLLPPTKPEREGWVDRQSLFGFHGRGRKGLIRLARRWGIESIPGPSTGCPLTEPQFSKNVFDLIRFHPTGTRWDFELLKVGRHFRFDERTKVVMGRNEAQNETLHRMHQLPDSSSTALMHPENFIGPLALITGPATEEALEFAAGLTVRYSKDVNPDNAQVRVFEQEGQRVIHGTLSRAVQNARTLASARK